MYRFYCLSNLNLKKDIGPRVCIKFCIFLATVAQERELSKERKCTDAEILEPADDKHHRHKKVIKLVYNFVDSGYKLDVRDEACSKSALKRTILSKLQVS